MILGITGGFGVGKSTVAQMLVARGAVWIEADSIVHELYKPRERGYEKIRGYFGEEFVDPERGVRREVLRRAVLGNPQKLWILNKLIHPLVAHEAFEKIRRIKKEKGVDAFVCLESFYLEASDLGRLIDKVVLVKRAPELIVDKRLRKWPLADIERFMALSPVHSKPDFVIENNGTMEELEERVERMMRRQFIA